MNDNKLIPGKEYYISNYSEAVALAGKDTRAFACYDMAGRMYFHAASPSKNLISYNYAAESPEPTIEPWTKDTFPLDAPVWVRRKGLEKLYLLSSIDRYNVFSINGTLCSNDSVLDEYERVMPDRTIAPCGVLK